MALYTEAYFRNLALGQAQLRGINTTRLFESLRDVYHGPHEQFDIFLSHSYMDREVVIGLTIELTTLGFKVYVDWMTDRGLDREKVNKETAERIRKRILQCKSLSYAATEHATHSKWMPWELGYKDGNNGKCAILPVAREVLKEALFPRQEYLSLYPYLSKDDQHSGRRRLRVNHDNGTIQAFDDWLQS